MKLKYFLLFIFLFSAIHPQRSGKNKVGRPYQIMFVTSRFPVISETFILNQITEFIKKGYPLSVHAFTKTYDTKVHPDVIKYDLVRRASYGRKLPPLHDYDVVYVQFGFLAEKILKEIKRQNYKGKVVVCFRGSDITSHAANHKKAYETLFKKAHLFLPVCRFLKEKLIAFGCKEEKIKVHYSAIDCKRFRYRAKKEKQKHEINIISVGRLVEKKGIEDVIEAVALLKNKYPSLRYTIVGAGPLEAKLHELIEKRGLQKQVMLYGWANQPEVIQQLYKSDIFILPSVTGKDGNQEGIPNALKEAMAVGLPVISTYHAGITELVDDGINGFLVEEHNSQAIADKIEYLLQNPQVAKVMGMHGHRKVLAEFDVEVVIKRLENIFKDLLKKK